ncbi:hypothetical protein DM860_012260 [Cuscuta australis]|uniref:Uncharacterized protein n=1 Tax=Cuscuta australis TaxID=267555 RepID=A0A328E6J9_9ASTE|nr:hypothetical protein DM860_012260 [Cuscuta australis]
MGILTAVGKQREIVKESKYGSYESDSRVCLRIQNLIEAFGEFKDNRLEQDVDVITETTINKRIKDVEHYHVGGDESSKKMKNIKIEKD